MNLKIILIFLVVLSFPIPALNAEKININTASLEELNKLDGVGPVIAQRIIDERPFSSLDDLIKVKGIGPKKLEAIKKQGLAWVGSAALESPDPIQEKIEPKNAEALKNYDSAAQIAKVDINIAPLKDLIRIVHIGEKRAQEIISLRPFYSLDDLTKIKGIGPKSLEDIKKQGLAWVDPSLKPLPSKDPEFKLSEKGTAAIDDYVKAPDSFSNKKSFSLFLVALILSLFFGVIILMVKKKLKAQS